MNNRYIDMAAQSVPVEFEVVSETGEKKDSVICGNKKYELYDHALNWNDAKAFCESKNGKLAEVLSAEEQRAVEQLVKSGSYDYYWLGLTDQEKEGEFKWNSGNAVGYTNWDSGEPNNSAEGENYVMIYKSSGKWNDVLVYGGLNGRTGFVCESEAPKTYNISYYLNGGSNDSGNPASYTSDNPYLNLKNPVRSNYTFDGWYTTRTYSTRLTSSTKCESDLNLYAKWIPTQYTVQLDVNGGKTLSQSKYNATVETTGLALPTPERDGYTFTGWYNKITGGDKVSSISNVTQNITLYARWEKNPEPHVHEFATLVEEVKATCTEGGHATYRCECGSEKINLYSGNRT